MMLITQIVKFKSHQYQMRAVSPNLMLAIVTRYMVHDCTCILCIDRLDFALILQSHCNIITAEWQVMCIFKALHRDPIEQHKELSLEEFYSFYEVRDLKWKQVI